MTICSSGKNVWYSLITQSITCSLKGSGTKENNEWIPQFGSKWNLVFDHKSILDFATIYLSIWLWESHYFFFFLSWRIIALQNFVDFCQAPMWIATDLPLNLFFISAIPPSRLFQGPCFSSLSYTANSHWLYI